MTPGNQRHPVDVEALGLLQHGKSKTFMFKVLWSDHNQVAIYRALTDFKKFQRDLKKQFPLEAGVLKKSERVIPKLKDTYNLLPKKKGSQKYLETLRKLETYSQNILKLDSKISQCSIVIQFFTLQNQDLNPLFPENSLVIMPSEKKEEDQPIIANHNLDVSGPLVSSSYLCIDDYETIDLKNRPFSVKKHQILDVVLKDVTGWWLVENEDRQLAWFPAPYLNAHQDAAGLSDDVEFHPKSTFYVVVKAYQARNCDEFTVSVGAVVEVLIKSNNGYWFVSYNSRTGYIPSIILKPYVNPCHKFQNILRRELYKSTPNIFEDISNEKVRPHPLHRSWLPSQSDEENEELERERSCSLGCVSQYSKSRMYVDSDSDSLRDHSRKSSMESSDDFSSIGGSSLSLSNSGIPKVPTRPNPGEITQKCSTVTRRALRKSLERTSLREAELRQ